MVKPSPAPSELVRAAEALEDGLVELESLSRAASKMRLDSEKSIARAAKDLTAALAVPERLAEGLLTLGAAMERMQVRQQAALEELARHAVTIQERVKKLDEHTRAYAALGQAASETTALLQSEGDRALIVESAKVRLSTIVDDAHTLLDAARADDFPEIAREAEALKQQMSALRRRFESTN
jgi:hypothetical protein